MTPPLQPDTSNDELPLLPGLRHADTAHGIAARLAELPPAAFQQAIDGSAAPPDLWLDLVLIFDERRQQDAVVRLLRRLATAIAGERECKLACLRLIANFRFTLANVLMAALIERHGHLPVLAEWREGARRYCYRQSLAGLPDHGALTPAFDRLSSCAAAIGDGGNELGCGSAGRRINPIVNGTSIAAASDAQSVVCAGVSNWGAYALIAALSVLHNENFLPTAEEEQALLQSLCEAGVVDGCTARREPTVDGLSADVCAAFLNELRWS